MKLQRISESSLRWMRRTAKGKSPNDVLRAMVRVIREAGLEDQVRGMALAKPLRKGGRRKKVPGA